MSEAKKDGGPAFPARPNWWDPDDMAYKEGDFQPGMTLRDYFAVHSTQPGVAEICKYAGIRNEGSRVYLSADDVVGQYFDAWWNSLSLERMCELSAQVRYAQADAMLKARQA